MDGWDRCKICGHDPMADFAVPDEPASSKRARRSDKAAKAEKPAKAPEPTTAPKAVTAPKPARAEEALEAATPLPPGTPDAGASARSRGRSALGVLAAFALVGGGAFAWYRLSGADEPAGDAGLAATVPTDAFFDTVTSTTTTSTPLATASTAPVIGGPGAGGPVDFAVAIGSVGAASFPLPGSAWPCAGRIVVEALGGVDALSAQGLAPTNFADGTLGDGPAVPPGAIDLVATRLVECGIDMVDLVVRDMASSNQASVMNCVNAGLDHALANRALAAQLATGTDAMAPDGELFAHVRDVATDCGG
jgi:hypothetical protein